MSDEQQGTSGAVDSAAAESTAVDPAAMKERVVEVLKTCYDPEIPIDIYELGLIYEIDVAETGDVEVEMTLTSPACPVAETLPPEVEQKVRTVDGVRTARVSVVWDPPWDKDRMSEAAQLHLGLI